MFSREQIPAPAPTGRPRLDLPWDAAAAPGTVPGEPFAALPPYPGAQPVLVAQADGPRAPAALVSPRAELGALGGVQVLLGLLHFGSGGILVSFASKRVEMLTTESWYLFWGGLLFIFSGSCSVAAGKNQSPYLLKGCMALNVTSVLATVVGVILVLWDLNICGELCYGPALRLELRVTRGLLGIQLLFTLLQTCTALTSTYLGWKAQQVASIQAAGFMADVVPPPAVVLPPPPAYDEIFRSAERHAT